MNIKHIEVNGQRFPLESINDITISAQEPTGEDVTTVWIKPSGTHSFGSGGLLDFERKPGSTSQGDYTLNEQGQLMETSDTSSSTANRATVMTPFFKDISYHLKCNQNNTSISDNYYKTYTVFFYGYDKEYISSQSVTLEGSSTKQYNYDETIMTFNLPENARYIRFLVPYNGYYSFEVVDEYVHASSRSMYSMSSPQFWVHDGEMYVRVG